jgi:Putative lumazine-binding
MTPQRAPVQTYVSQYDAIVKTMKGYVEGVREGKSELMRPVFHPNATFFGHYPGGVMTGPIQQLFDFIDNNGPAPDVQSRFASVQIVGKIASLILKSRAIQAGSPEQAYRCPISSR